MFERMNAKECEGDEPIPASDAEIKALSRSVPPDIREGIEKMNTTLKRDTENGFWRKSGPDRAAKVNGYGPKPDQSWAFQAAPNGSENVWKKILAEGEGFEPSVRFPVHTLSRRAPSTARPPLLGGRQPITFP